MTACKAKSLTSAAFLVLVLANSANASVLPQLLAGRNLDSLKQQHDQAIHTNTQACIPEKHSDTLNLLQMIASFVIGMLVMFLVKYGFDKCKQSQSDPPQRQVATAQDLDETDNNSQEDSIEMVEKPNKKERFNGDKAPVNKEEVTSLMPKGVPYAEMSPQQDSESRERIQELEKRITKQEKEIDESKAAYESSQLKIEKLEQKNYSLKGENGQFKAKFADLTKKNEDQKAEISEFKLQYKQYVQKNKKLTVDNQTLKQQVLIGQAKLSAGNSEGASTSGSTMPSSAPQMNSSAPSFEPTKMMETPEKIQQPFETPEETKEVEEPERVVEPRVDTRDSVNALRGATMNYRPTDNCEIKYNPKWAATPAFKKWLIEAFGNDENETFDEICKEIVDKAFTGATSAGWTGKFTFVCAIFPTEEYTFDEKYKKWWYYEYDLDSKFICVFLKVDHDRKEDVKLAVPIVEDLRHQKNQGFAIYALNHEYEQP